MARWHVCWGIPRDALNRAQWLSCHGALRTSGPGVCVVLTDVLLFDAFSGSGTFPWKKMPDRVPLFAVRIDTTPLKWDQRSRQKSYSVRQRAYKNYQLV